MRAVMWNLILLAALLEFVGCARTQPQTGMPPAGDVVAVTVTLPNPLPPKPVKKADPPKTESDIADNKAHDKSDDSGGAQPSGDASMLGAGPPVAPEVGPTGAASMIGAGPPVMPEIGPNGIIPIGWR
jgi:hypothetical protein